MFINGPCVLVGGNGKETESGDLPAKGLFNCRKKKKTPFTHRKQFSKK